MLITKTHKSLKFLYSFEQKGTKMADPILESSLKTCKIPFALNFSLTITTSKSCQILAVPKKTASMTRLIN
jgi:hypothetical protein